MARRFSVSLALLSALAMAAPAIGSAEDNPWTFIRKMMQPPSGKAVRKLKPPKLFAPLAPVGGGIAEDVVVPMPRLRPTVAAASALAKSEPLPEPESAALPDAKPAVVVGPDGRLTNPFVEAGAGGAREEPEATPELPMMGYAPASDAMPMPRLRPSHDGRALASLPPEPLPPLIEPPPAAMMTCGPVLAMLGVEASPLAPIAEGQCSVAAPVAVAALESGAVDMTMKAIVNCDIAERFAEWLRDEVQPAAKSILHGRVTGLRIAAGYHCRNRNNAKEGKLSEHATGNAIDIAAFRVNERWIVVGADSDSDPEARFLAAVRGSACGPFTTVLGPGSDAFHSDHFHLDLAARNRRGKSRGLYCH